MTFYFWRREKHVRNFWALVPPILAIVLALITKEAYSSLFIGVLGGRPFRGEFLPGGGAERRHQR